MSWIKKYEPKSLDDFILPPAKRLRSILYNWDENGISSSRIPLLLGDKGSGKTTIAKYLAQKHTSLVDKDGNKIWTNYRGSNCLKKTLSDISMLAGWSDNPVYITIDEINRSSSEFIMGLRHVYDSLITSGFIRIIATANELGDLETLEGGSILDRMSVINYKGLTLESVASRCCDILEYEGIKYSGEDVVSICEENQKRGQQLNPPTGISLRSCIEECEERSIGGELI